MQFENSVYRKLVCDVRECVCVTPILHTDFYPKLLEKLFDLYFQ